MASLEPVIDVGGDDGVSEAGDWAVPSTALAHALRTPLNVLKGYTTLLVSGELGRLSPDAVAAATEMRHAVGDLERVVGLLARLPSPARAGATDLDLTVLIDTALARAGYAPAPGGTLEVAAVAWPGWRDLIAAVAQMCADEGAPAIELTVSRAHMAWRAGAPRARGGDGRLAALAARRRAAAGGISLHLPASGGAVLEAPGLIHGCGATTYRQVEVTDVR